MPGNTRENCSTSRARSWAPQRASHPKPTTTEGPFLLGAEVGQAWSPEHHQSGLGAPGVGLRDSHKNSKTKIPKSPKTQIPKIPDTPRSGRQKPRPVCKLELNAANGEAGGVSTAGLARACARGGFRAGHV